MLRLLLLLTIDGSREGLAAAVGAARASQQQQQQEGWQQNLPE
jgi:hypothetical protein